MPRPAFSSPSSSPAMTWRFFVLRPVDLVGKRTTPGEVAFASGGAVVGLIWLAREVGVFELLGAAEVVVEAAVVVTVVVSAAKRERKKNQTHMSLVRRKHTACCKFRITHSQS